MALSAPRRSGVLRERLSARYRFRLLAALSAGTAELLRAQQRLTRAVHRGSDVPTGIIGWRRAWTVSMISALSMPCRYTDVMPRLLWPAGAG